MTIFFAAVRKEAVWPGADGVLVELELGELVEVPVRSRQERLDDVARENDGLLKRVENRERVAMLLVEDEDDAPRACRACVRRSRRAGHARRERSVPEANFVDVAPARADAEALVRAPELECVLHVRAGDRLAVAPVRSGIEDDLDRVPVHRVRLGEKRLKMSGVRVEREERLVEQIVRLVAVRHRPGRRAQERVERRRLPPLEPPDVERLVARERVSRVVLGVTLEESGSAATERESAQESGATHCCCAPCMSALKLREVFGVLREDVLENALRRIERRNERVHRQSLKRGASVAVDAGAHRQRLEGLDDLKGRSENLPVAALPTVSGTGPWAVIVQETSTTTSSGKSASAPRLSVSTHWMSRRSL